MRCVTKTCEHNITVTAVPSIRLSCRKSTCRWFMVCLHKIITVRNRIENGTKVSAIKLLIIRNYVRQCWIQSTNRVSKKNFARPNNTVLGPWDRLRLLSKYKIWGQMNPLVNFHKCFISCAAKCPDNIHFIQCSDKHNSEV